MGHQVRGQSKAREDCLQCRKMKIPLFSYNNLLKWFIMPGSYSRDATTSVKSKRIKDNLFTKNTYCLICVVICLSNLK